MEIHNGRGDSSHARVDSLLRSIAQSSATLNHKAEAATREIERLEKRLVDAEVGIAVEHACILSEETTWRSDGGKEEPAQRSVNLGYGKAKSKWGITVRVQWQGKKRVRDHQWNKDLDSEVFLLRKADRELRVLAQPHLPGLVAAIANALDDRLALLEARQAEVAEATVDGHAGPHDDAGGSPGEPGDEEVPQPIQASASANDHANALRGSPR
ncbi:MAG: hypothetical protein B7733_04135 [Myxococcales bacterium FL481]|nr:MAG: hypothetical protein B7733_04135 [Myxococcales bacterium FL481]